MPWEELQLRYELFASRKNAVDLVMANPIAGSRLPTVNVTILSGFFIRTDPVLGTEVQEPATRERLDVVKDDLSALGDLVRNLALSGSGNFAATVDQRTAEIRSQALTNSVLHKPASWLWCRQRRVKSCRKSPKRCL